MESGDFDEPAEAVAAVIQYLLEDDQCIPIDYDEIIEADRQTGWDDPAGMGGFRQYTYLACTQVETRFLRSVFDFVCTDVFVSVRLIVRLVPLFGISLPTIRFKFPS